jgi:hypothetical protein
MHIFGDIALSLFNRTGMLEVIERYIGLARSAIGRRSRPVELAKA